MDINQPFSANVAIGLTNDLYRKIYGLLIEDLPTLQAANDKATFDQRAKELDDYLVALFSFLKAGTTSEVFAIYANIRDVWYNPPLPMLAWNGATEVVKKNVVTLNQYLFDLASGLESGSFLSE